MNGRIYDPTLGRFLQADPHIQAPNNSQNYNRYSYVLNNPMSYTDPSGFFFKKLLRAIAKVPILNTAINVGLNFIPGCQVWCSAAFSAATTYAVTGSLKAAFTAGAISAATAYAFSEIGSHFDGLNAGAAGDGLYNFGGNFLKAGQIAQQISAHALVGGISSQLQGGKFGHGFFSAGVTKGIGGAFLPGGDDLTTGEIAQGTVVSAVIGGTASKISGGKFANGAQTGAFQFLFNQAGKAIKKWSYENQRKKGLLRLGIDGSSGLRAKEIRAMKGLYSPKDAFVFATHGNEDGIYLGGVTQMMDGPSSLSDIVSTLDGAGYEGDQPLFMLSCDLANSGMGQQLSNHYNQVVIGASDGHMQINGSASRGYSYAPKNSDAYIKEFKPGG